MAAACFSQLMRCCNLHEQAELMTFIVKRLKHWRFENANKVVIEQAVYLLRDEG